MICMLKTKAPQTKSIDENLYWSPDKLFSYNRLLNFVLGGRGIGKTYSTKKWLIKRFIKTGEQFIYLRRYKTHLNADTVKSFFDKIALDEDFKDVEFKVKDGQFFINKKLAGFAIPLSSWQNKKGSEYPLVTTIFYDEFLKEKDTSHYLHNEPQALLNFAESVFREKIIFSTTNVRVICLANSTTITNPFFTYFKLIPKKEVQFNLFKHNKEIVVEIPEMREFTDLKAQGRFGALIGQTEYAKMSIDNDFAYDTHEFIEKKSRAAYPLFNVKKDNVITGIFMDAAQGLLFASNVYDTGKPIYALTKADFTEHTIYAPYAKDHYHLKRLLQAFQKGLIRFEDMRVRNQMYDVFNVWGLR